MTIWFLPVASGGVALGGARDRDRTGTPAIREAADFKSAVSTYFTTRAQQHNLRIVKQKSPWPIYLPGA